MIVFNNPTQVTSAIENSAFLRLAEVETTNSRLSLSFESIVRKNLGKEEVVQIGRYLESPAADASFISFKSKTVSRRHAQIWFDRESKCFIRDLKSSAGTFVNGARLETSAEIKHGDILQLGVSLQDDENPQHRCVRMRVELEENQRSHVDDITVIPESVQAAEPLPEESCSSLSHSPYRVPIERLDEYFPKERLPKYREEEIRAIRHLLEIIHKTSWSRIPRIYIVLRVTDSLQDIELFIKSEICDISFPFSSAALPRSLEPSTVHKFLEAQKVVLTKALDLEKADDGRHVSFEDGELLPFETIALLGIGACGSVDKVFSLLSHETYARKSIRRARNFQRERQGISQFKNELAALKRVRHEHCVKLIGSYTYSDHIGLIMSPVCDCDLKTYLSAAARNPDKLSNLRTFFGCLAAALCYLHLECRIRHKDIKPQNILVKGNRVYLTDFNISHDWSELSRSTTQSISAHTPIYAAPEVIHGDLAHNSSSDIWSLGCVFLEMITVLKGHSVNELRDFFKKTQDDIKFYRNVVSASEWMEALKTESDHDNTPILWIQSMLSLEASLRPKAASLLETITQASRYDPNREQQEVFCGSCCVEEEGMSSTGAAADASDNGDGTESEVHPAKEAYEGSRYSDVAEERTEMRQELLRTGAEAGTESAIVDLHELPEADRGDNLPPNLDTEHDSRDNPSDRSMLVASVHNIVIELGRPEDRNACEIDSTDTADILRKSAFEFLLPEGTDFIQSLHEASKNGDSVAVNELLLHGAHIDERDRGSWTPLHWAAAAGNLVTTRLLLQRGANILIQDSKGCTALLYAAKLGHKHIVSSICTFLKPSHQFWSDFVTSFGRSRDEENYRAMVFMVLNVLELLSSDYLDYFTRWASLWLQNAIETDDTVMIRGIIRAAQVDVNCRFKRNDHEPTWTLLHGAVTAKNTASVIELLEHGANINIKVENGRSPLIQAFSICSKEMMLLLLENGAQITVLDFPIRNFGVESTSDQFIECELLLYETGMKEGLHKQVEETAKETFLHQAVSDEHITVVDGLLKLGISPHVLDKEDRLPLHYAAISGHSGMAELELLLKSGSRTNVGDVAGNTPAHLAAILNHASILDLFKGAPCLSFPNKQYLTPLGCAIIEGNTACVKSLLSLGVDLEAVQGDFEQKAIGLAAQHKRLDILKVLIDNGADLLSRCKSGETVLHEAVISGSESIVQYLLDLDKIESLIRAKERDGWTALHLAAYTGEKELLARLYPKCLQLGIAVGNTDSGQSLLHVAADRGKTETVKYLLDNGFYPDVINLVNSKHPTPLHGAVGHKRHSTVRLLLESGATGRVTAKGPTLLHIACKEGDVNLLELLLSSKLDAKESLQIQTEDGETPLHWAAMWESPSASDDSSSETHPNECIDILLKRGFDAEAENFNSSTPLFVAIKKRRLYNVAPFLDHGAKLNIRDRKKNTPLHFAAQRGQLDLVNSLLLKGASFSAENDKGKTPRDMAVSRNHTEIAKILQKLAKARRSR